MEYITFKNKWGQTNKLWVTKEGNKFFCYRLDNINYKSNDMGDFDPPKEYKTFNGKSYEDRLSAEHAIEAYIDIGIKAGVYTDKKIV